MPHLKAILPEFAAKTRNETDNLFYEFTINGDEVFWAKATSTPKRCWQSMKPDHSGTQEEISSPRSQRSQSISGFASPRSLRGRRSIIKCVAPPSLLPDSILQDAVNPVQFFAVTFDLAFQAANR
jgi:hypothetical protein